MKVSKKLKELPTIDYREITPIQGELKTLSESNEQRLADSFAKFGFISPFHLWNNKGTWYAIDGHQRLSVLTKRELKPYKLPYIEIEAKTEQEAKEKLLVISSQYGTITQDGLETFMLDFEDSDIDEMIFFDGLDFGKDDELEQITPQEGGSLVSRFIVPPFSVLDARQGYWQDRKRWWLGVGIESELGRDALAYTGNASTLADGTSFYAGKESGVSVFDPVLCELSYKWFNVENGSVLDPFAGGSVRGVVASILGYKYSGNDLSSKQIRANRINAKSIGCEMPQWTIGDSLDIKTKLKGDYDMIFTCPPYGNLEVYSDNKKDLSAMTYNDFITTYRAIIKSSIDMLKVDRFAVIVVGDFRDKNGAYQNFVSDTIRSFLDCGMVLYNEMILVTQIGNLGMRVGGYFKSRKMGKAHQNVLVFYKGDISNIKTNYSDIDMRYMDEQRKVVD